MLSSALRKISASVLQRSFSRNVGSACGCTTRTTPKVSSFDLSQLRNSLDISVPPLKRAPIEIPKVTIEIPIIRKDHIFEDPRSLIIVKDPTIVIEQQAARLIVIRRRKMKRHKLKKLRKKMKFAWAKVRQKREMKKEKEFHVEIMSQIRTAEQFSAETYVQDKLTKANEVLIPKLWRGKRLPEFVIVDLLEKAKIKREAKLERKERRKKMSLMVSDFKV